jgi:putative transposase
MRVAIEKDMPDQLLAHRNPRKALGANGSFALLKKALAAGVAKPAIEEPAGRRTREEEDGRRNARPNRKRSGRARREGVLDGALSTGGPRDFAGVHEKMILSGRETVVRDKILSMYARGMAAREIQRHLFELYGIEFSPDSIAAATGAVPAMIAEWRNRPLEATYPLVFFDALRVKIREEGLMRGKVVHMAVGIQTDGAKDILGLWIEDAEDSGFWLRAMGELKSRGVHDVLIAVVEGSNGVFEAVSAHFPRTLVQTSIVHLIRHSLDFPSWAERKTLANALKAIYESGDAGAAMAALDIFAASALAEKYPAIAQNWRRRWPQVVPFFALPEAVRRIICARKAIESLNEKLRRAARARNHFSSDEAALFLVLRNAAGERKMPPREWARAKIQLAAMFEDRFVQA